MRRPAHPRLPHPIGHTINRDERGTAMVEYSLVLALVAVVAFGLVGAVGQETLDIYTRIGNAIHAFFP